jgi:type I restriction-modification system DNA methylase subunit
MNDTSMRCDLARNRKNATTAEDTATVGFERKLWASADALRNNMDAAEYKHVVLGLIFLKYISDAFEARHAELDARIAHGDTFHNDLHPDLKADYVIANPPFNDSDWRGDLLKDDRRWVYGTPPTGNANFAWVQHFIYHLAPTGVAGFVLANGSMSSNQSGEGEIRKAIIEADLVDCMVALPGQLFYSTQIPVCLWFLARDKKNGRFRDRRGETLFIDARRLGTMVDRTHRELTDEDVARIADTCHAWRRKSATDASATDASVGAKHSHYPANASPS